MNGDTSVALAQDHDVPLVLKLLKDTARWLHERKIDQWAYLRDGGEDDEIREAVLAGKTYLARQSGEIVGTFTLYGQQSEWDAHIWSERSGDAVYLHRLTVDRGRSGHGIGGKLIKLIEQECRRMNKAYLRLDCVAGNEKLNGFYTDHGFTSLGERDHHRMYQKSLADADD